VKAPTDAGAETSAAIEVRHVYPVEATSLIEVLLVEECSIDTTRRLFHRVNGRQGVCEGKLFRDVEELRDLGCLPF
jgi:hypothetical protein